ncbi:uncharacterized protein YecE (DUF72 family) [Pelomonas saccharophila]|uniref:Uncharacterized protein YecE (DUF72 family) n=1 Tax=Roseateles saccharophilus TaxID=304 RepID=A0ABU1YGY5_ROSSA|nr:DUF72 domain-containing protein [Roseateles saccharophilus]MDR7268122.1 uncharacterized protein YecE (DUF72 family) [Roseateles saccharophilus]
MQDELFGGEVPARRSRGVQPAPPEADDQALAAALSPHIHLGTSTWSYPGWEGLVWAGKHSEATLSKTGLTAYAAHPLLRAVGIDRGFYRPITASEFQRHAEQVPKGFRFTVKAPSLVTDALLRSEDGRRQEPNPLFLDAVTALQTFIEPAYEGLGTTIGALVFQLSPLPALRLSRMNEQLDRLHALLLALPKPPAGVLAVEVRDAAWLCPDFVALLRGTGARYCVGLHPKLPPLQEQLPLLRALWPGPLVVRWNLNRLHGPYGYEEAEKLYGEFNAMLDPDPETRAELARVIRGTAGAGQDAFVTISNKAEGSAPLSVRALAEAIVKG